MTDERTILAPVYALYGDVTVGAHLDQWWHVTIHAANPGREVVARAEAHTFAEALAEAAVKVVGMAVVA